jgi:UDP-N-acetylmuramoylalanine--D-glutamate ligase
MADAVRLAGQLAEAGDVVLLSPAAASFDMFTDYAARGDAFRQAVTDLEASR